MIRTSIHERRIAASVESVGELLDSLSTAGDRLWPRHQWPRMRLDGPLRVGSAGGHGPVRYVVQSYEPGRSVTFTFTKPAGFHGHHGFTVAEAGESAAVVRHELVMVVTGLARVTWPLFYRPLHDALIEECLDRAQSEAGDPPATPARRSLWVKLLRSLLKA